VIIPVLHLTNAVSLLSYRLAGMASRFDSIRQEWSMDGAKGRLLGEHAISGEVRAARRLGDATHAGRSVTVNLAESPLGWLFSRGLVTPRQFEAGERLRADWERAHLSPRVTMAWDSGPVARGRGGAAPSSDPTGTQLDARERFQAAIAATGSGLADILWRVVCSGDGMREAETALGWPARAGKLVLTFALDRVADFYRIPGAARADASAKDSAP
jgi:hypothetical protein